MVSSVAWRCGIACLGLSLLAACGGGGGGSDGPVTRGPALPEPDTQVPQDTTGMRTAAIDLLADWAPGSVPDYTAISAVPTTGSARYDGYLYGDVSTRTDAVTDSLIGALTLDVAFGATGVAFSGSARDFVDSRDDPLSGRLTVSGGTLNRNGNPANDATLRGVAVAGTLRDTDGVALVFGLQLEGDFLGVTADAIGGEAIGRVRVGGTDQNFDGGFITAD